MQPSARVVVAASAHALVRGRKVSSNAPERHLRITAAPMGEHLQCYKGERDLRFGGTLQELRGGVYMRVEGANGIFARWAGQ